MSPLRKRRTRQHVIADLSFNYVERLILRRGWVARRPYPDYGVDMQMETYNDEGEVENGWVLFQLKATDRMTRKRGAIPVRLEWSELLYWLNERLPGILVYYDAQADCAWWLHLQQALRAVELRIDAPPADTITFHVPMENVLDEAAILSFAKLRNAAVPSIGDRAW
ncbi:MAG TPA: DUF4365 domain-containing protein [Pirellulales bacterium]|nr:DUF4365 domain-containing protein [Pirellulales bacterium]